MDNKIVRLRLLSARNEAQLYNLSVSSDLALNSRRRSNLDWAGLANPGLAVTCCSSATLPVGFSAFVASAESGVSVAIIAADPARKERIYHSNQNKPRMQMSRTIYEYIRNLNRCHTIKILAKI